MRLLARLALVGGLLACAAPAIATAAETGGCESFKWPVATEIKWMTAADSQAVASGAKLDAPPAKALSVSLSPIKDVKFAVPPTGKPKGNSAEEFGAVVEFANVADPGTYQVSLSGAGWIDVVQNGKSLASKSHSGKSDCDGLRKSVRFELASGPLTIELSGVPKEAIKLTIRRAD